MTSKLKNKLKKPEPLMLKGQCNDNDGKQKLKL